MKLDHPSMLNMELKYYSFYVGWWRTSKAMWVLKDVKIPAKNHLDAIILHYNMMVLANRISNNNRVLSRIKNTKIYVPTSGYVHITYRQVIEYERLEEKSRGYTIHQFKKIRIYNSHEFIQEFD